MTLGAAELARQICARVLSVTEVTDAHIARIETVNSRINAIVTPMYDAAREAAAADCRISTPGAGDLPPLFGVPLTGKDCWPVPGVRFTAARGITATMSPSGTPRIVRRIRAAGAIVLGKTNCPDMVFGVQTVNPIFGRTRNPRSLSDSAGGSSGGEGAIIAARGSPLGIGGDIGGSIRALPPPTAAWPRKRPRAACRPKATARDQRGRPRLESRRRDRPPCGGSSVNVRGP